MSGAVGAAAEPLVRHSDKLYLSFGLNILLATEPYT